MRDNIWVLAEAWRGEISEITYQLLALGRELADGLGSPLEAVLLGHRTEHRLATLGAADRVLYVDDPRVGQPVAAARAHALAALIRERQPRALLVPLTNVSWDEVGLLPACLEAPMVNSCRDVRIAGGGLQAECLLYGGKIVATVAAPEPSILGVLPGIRPAEPGRVERSPEIESLTLPIPEGLERNNCSTEAVEAPRSQGLRPSRTGVRRRERNTASVDASAAEWDSYSATGPKPAVRFQGYLEPEAGDVDLTQQDVLVAIGRGVGMEDDVELAEELAEALGGAVCGSRPVIDQGWLPLARQVGKSGVIVRPRAYLAFGISGAPEHVEGIMDSELIIAVNTDPEAPIFGVAHYGIVEDAAEMLEALTEAARVPA